MPTARRGMLRRTRPFGMGKENAAMNGDSKPKRRWYQFSLRTLLIATAMVAVACSLVVRKLDRKRREREVVQSFLALDTSHPVVLYNFQSDPETGPFAEPYGPAWLRGLLGDDFFSEVTGVMLSNTSADDGALCHVDRLTELRCVDLADTKITDAALLRLAHLPHLEVLYLNGTQIDDVGLAQLAEMKSLKTLNLAETKVTDAGLVTIGQLGQLQILDLRGTAITDAGISHLRRLTRLTALSLLSTKTTDEGVRKLQRALPNCSIDR